MGELLMRVVFRPLIIYEAALAYTVVSRPLPNFVSAAVIKSGCERGTCRLALAI